MPEPSNPMETPPSSSSPKPESKKRKRGSAPSPPTPPALPVDEATWKQVLDQTPCISIIVGPDGTVLYFSRFAEQITGYFAAEVLGKDYLEFFLPDELTRQAAAEQLKKCLTGHLPLTPTEGYEQPLWVKDGSPRWVFWHCQLLGGFTKQPVLLATGCDITELKRAEEELRQSHGFFKTVLDAAPCMTVILRRDHTVAYLSSYGEQVTGYTAQEVFGKNYFDIFIPDPEVREGIYNDIQKVANGAPTRGYENPVWCKDGSKRWFVWNSEFLPDFEGEAGLMGIGLDVTAYKQAEELLRASEARTHALLEAIPDWMFRLRLDGTFLDFHVQNPQDLLVPPEKIVGSDLHQYPAPPDMVEKILATARRAVETGQLQSLEYSLSRPSGVHHHEARIVPSGRDEVVVIVRDITEQKQTHEALRASEARTRALLEAMPDWMFRYRLDGTFLDFHAQNPAELLLPPESIIGNNIRKTFLPTAVVDQILAAAQRAQESGQLQLLEYSLALPEGTRHFESRVVPSGADEVVSIVRDITRRKRTFEQLRQLSARLITSQEEASRQIARELHDVFSQRLAVLGLELSVLEQQTSPGSPAAGKLHWLGEEIERMAKDVHDLSRELHPAILRDLGLAVALRAECESFSRHHGIGAEFIPQNPPESLPEEVSLCLYRVVQESLRNIARHARAKQVQVTLAGAAKQVTLAVEDFGDGFDLEEAKGKGGLGLVSMEERVRLVNGTFSIRSQPRQGTRVQVRIPLPHR